MQKYYSVPRYLGLNGVHTNKKKTIYHFGFAEKNKISAEFDQSGKKLITYLLKPKTKKQISQKFKLKLSETSKLIESLEHQGLIKEDFKKITPPEFKRYDRHLLFYQMNDLDPIQSQKIISSKTIALIGCGGIGNWVSLNLIGFGFKKIILIDFDTIEETNLTRQVLFNEEDIGKLKGQVAQKTLQKKNKNTQVEFVKLKVSSAVQIQNAISESDFVIHSADRPAAIHDWINQACLNLKIPYLNVGYMDGVGVIGPLTIPFETSCYSCFKSTTEATQINTLKDLMNYQAPSFGPLNAMAATIGAMELVKYFILPQKLQSQDTMINIDPITFELSKTKYQRDHKCQACAKS